MSSGGVEQVPLLEVDKEDDYDGVTVKMKEPMDLEAFLAALRASISQWKQKGKKGAWIKLPIGLSNLVHPAVEVLVVQEASGKFKGTGVWKFPTGVINEDICAAAIGEVQEETGIETEFVEILAFRQSHKSLYTKSDFFFVCLLQPKSTEIKKQIVEIEAAQWMPIDAYADQPFVRDNQQFPATAKVCIERSNQQITGFTPKAVTTGSGKKTYIYCPK